MPNPADSNQDDVGIRCIHCGQVNLSSSRDRIDNWTCNYCHSGFISITMLSNLAPRDLINQIGRKGKRGQKDCPQCHKKMDIVGVHFNHRDLELDVCRKCHILWFESGELMRMLRHRAPENHVPGEDNLPQASPLKRYEREEAKVGVRAPRETAPPPVALSPKQTYAIALVCGLVAPIVMHNLDLVARFGFWNAEPLRLYGATALTSLFMHDSVGTLLPCLFLLLLAGTFVEQKMGHDRFFWLFACSGLAGRLLYWASGTVRDPIAIGSSCAITGIVVYAFLVFPFRTVLFPTEHKWKSPADALSKVTVAIVTMVAFYVAWNFLAAAIRKVATGADPNVFNDTIFASISEWLESPNSRAHMAGAGVGALWCLVDAMFRPSGPTTRPPRAGDKFRKAKVRV